MFRERYATQFGGWVASFTTARITRELGVTRQAVGQWIAGVTAPDANNLDKLVNAAAGELTRDDILRHRHEVKACKGRNTAPQEQRPRRRSR